MATLGFVFGALALAAAPHGGPPKWAVAVLPSGHEFSLEVAADDESRIRGYMYRDRVGPREGMIFVFDQVGRHGIWMKNCRVSLDVVWLDERLRVLHVEERLAPCPEKGACPTHMPPQPSRYVLEFAAGTVREEKLAIGQSVIVLSDPALR